MFDEALEPPSNSELLKNSLLYRHFQAQREEVMRHRWSASERAGHDIGFARALTEWILRYRSAWLKRQR
jgi:hypothetical protein